MGWRLENYFAKQSPSFFLDTLSIRLDTDEKASIYVCIFFFFFFFEKRDSVAFMLLWVLCTIYGIHKPLFSAKLSLKIGLMALFIHLKIILL